MRIFGILNMSGNRVHTHLQYFECFISLKISVFQIAGHLGIRVIFILPFVFRRLKEHGHDLHTCSSVTRL